MNFLKILFLTSFSKRAKIIGKGKVKINVQIPIESVLRKTCQKVASPINIWKYRSPTQSCPKTEPPGK